MAKTAKKTYFSKHRFFNLALIIVLLSGYIAVATPLSVYALPNSTYITLGTHPEAAVQATASGKVLRYLAVNNNKIYAGFGDLDINTGPIAIDPFDISTGQFDGPQIVAQTEEIDVFRTIGGKLYAPDADPRGNVVSYGGYSVGPPWSEPQPVVALHMRDITSLSSTSDLWMAGYVSNGGIIWHSTDAGATWQVSKTGDIFMWIAAVNGKIVTQGYGVPYSWIFDGTSWTQGPDIIGYSTANYTLYGTQANTPTIPEVFKGKLIDRERGLETFDGTTVSPILGFGPSVLQCSSTPCSNVVNMTIDPSGNYFYVLKNDGTVVRSADLSTWTTVATNVPSTASSIAVTGNYVYFGTTDSKLLRSQNQIGGVSQVSGDTNADGHVDAADLTTFLTNWQTANSSCDFNSDGTDNILDFSILLSNYGT